MVIDDLEEYAHYEHDDRIVFKMPSMIEDCKQFMRERGQSKTLYDNYLKTKPSSNRESNADRKVTSIRFVIESLNKSIKRFRFLAQQIKDCLSIYKVETN